MCTYIYNRIIDKEPVGWIWSVTVQVLGYRVESYIYKDPRNAFIISYNPPGRPQWWSKVEDLPFSNSPKSSFLVSKMVWNESIYSLEKDFTKKDQRNVFLLNL